MVAWNDRALLCGWRERWAELANERLCELGHDVRIDHRSYAEQGIELEPQHKIGPAGARRAARDEDAERVAEHRDIARRNGERIAADPNVALDALTRQHSTFTRHDLARFVSRHTDGAEQFAEVMAKVGASPELVRVGVDGRGRERLSTRGMLAAEQRMEGHAAGLAGGDAHRVLHVAAWRALRAAERDGLVLGEEQRDAYRHVTSGPDLAAVVGYAGTGKSAMLGVARRAWEAEGYRVRGAALSGIAAEGLEAGSGIESRTLASLEYGWTAGRDALTAKDVLVVDEAGMVGSRQMERVLGAAAAAGAKVVLVGDPEQLQAIEAGAAFRAVAERHGAVEISQVRRQREEWQREATRALATGRTGAALGRYEAAGMVQGHATQEAARAALVAGWDAERQESPQQSRVMLAYTRADVAELNRLARERLRAAGALGAEHLIATERGERAFAAGDRLMFLRNERGLGAGPGRGGVAVKNGSLGTVLAVEGAGERLRVRLDGPGGTGTAREVAFPVRAYGHVEHGYAVTVHKAQGVTVDRAHVLASGHMDRHAAYVALTRHREGVALHWSVEALGSREGLSRTLGRERAKDTSLDYGMGQEPGAGEGVAWRYAERRGLDPLRPESAIVVPERPAEVPAPRRGRFAGLRLGDVSRTAGAERLRQAKAAGQALEAEAGRAQRAEPPAPVPAPRRPAVAPEAALPRAVSRFAAAWSDAQRMAEQELPVLPHQRAALLAGQQAVEAARPGFTQDLAEALRGWPGSAAEAGRLSGQRARAALIKAAERVQEERLALEGRVREAVRGWDRLERAHDQAVRVRDWDAARAATGRLEAHARELKRDAALEGVLRTRREEFGVAEGSRLARVVQAPSQRPSQGLSMGM